MAGVSRFSYINGHFFIYKKYQIQFTIIFSKKEHRLRLHLWLYVFVNDKTLNHKSHNVTQNTLSIACQSIIRLNCHQRKYIYITQKNENKHELK